MSSDETCQRCKAAVPALLGPPPGEADTWKRYKVRMRRVEVTHTLTFSMFTRRWWPKNPHDVLRETRTDFALCDNCARDVFLLAQGLPAIYIQPKLAEASRG